MGIVRDAPFNIPDPTHIHALPEQLLQLGERTAGWLGLALTCQDISSVRTVH